MVTQKEFEDTIKKFNTIEDVRDVIWKKAKNLLQKDYSIEAYLLILATWNFARFRYAMKKFDLNNFEKILIKLEPTFSKLEHERFEDLNFEMYEKNIAFIYDQLAQINGIDYTGATKIMALKNSNLFVMWDTTIRKMYNQRLVRGKKIPQKPNGMDYVCFLRNLREEFGNLSIPHKNKSLAKAIDEYNYVKAKERRWRRWNYGFSNILRRSKRNWRK